jgi:3-oxoadipate enol-lactonase
MPMVKVGDIQLNYTLHGEAGPWVVLIGGLAGGNWQSWTGQLPALTKEFRVLAFDNRGIGESDSPDYPYTTRMMANDTFAVMDAAGIEQAHVIGKSMGGAIGQIMAVEQPRRVRSLTQTSSFAKLDPRGVRILENWRNSVSHSGWEQFCRELLAHFFTAEYFEQNPEGVARAERALVGTKRTVHGYMHTSAAVETHDTWEILDQVRVPSLLLCGGEDLVTPPRQTEAMGKRIPGAEVHIIPRSMHGFLAERPESVQLIVDFLRRH